MSDYRPSSTDYNFQLKDCFLGAQILFVAFGALVLVPLLTGLNPNVALFTAGLGTLVFQVITRGKVPIFLASSFAFIACLYRPHPVRRQNMGHSRHHVRLSSGPA